MDLLEGLNEAQRDAVTTTEGYVRVIAGAGSGKTRALTRRFAYLVNDLGILPGNILCVTFTSKAANEMRQRIHQLTGDNDTGYINTFHGFCCSVLQEESYAISYPKQFLVLDNADIDAMLGLIYEEEGLTLRDMTFSAARDMIEMEKLVKHPEYWRELISMTADELKARCRAAHTAEEKIFYGYLWQEKKCYGLDYNDLLILTMAIFEDRKEIREKWQDRLEYMMIDEFQDIDAIQYKLMQVLSGMHKNLFVVGDPDQTIYTWRGASTRFLMDFDQVFLGTKTIVMTENYRSTPEILAAANHLIARNLSRIPKELTAVKAPGQPVIGFHGKTGEAEAAWIAKEAGKLHESGAAYGDIAVLYRAHYVTRTVEDALMKAKIPYTLYSGVPFFGRQEIKDALAYLRLLAYQDDLSFQRVVNRPKRNIGERRMAFLEKAAEEEHTTLYEALKAHSEDDLFKRTKAGAFLSLIESLRDGLSQRPVSEVLADLLEQSGYERMLRTEGSQERLDNLAELRQAVYEYETTCGEESSVPDFLRRAALLGNADDIGKADRVKLLTVHSAKGLEFPYVFLCAMNEGIFPSRKTRTIDAMEEERRLAFVAVTRAEKGLYLSESEGTNLSGSVRYPSRFLFDMDDTVRWETKADDSLIAGAHEYIRLSGEGLKVLTPEAGLAIGSRVRHRVFGEGQIIGEDRAKSAWIIQFDKMSTKRLLSWKAPLEKL